MFEKHKKIFNLQGGNMKALVSTRKDTSITGTVFVKINGVTSTLPVHHYQTYTYNGKSYIFVIGTSCCVHDLDDSLVDAAGNSKIGPGDLLCSGPEVQMDI